MKISFKNIIASLTIVCFFINPIFVMAVTNIQEAPKGDTSPASYSNSVSNQIQSSVNGVDTSNAPKAIPVKENGGALGSAAGNIAGCGAGQMLANIITSSVSSATGNAVSSVVSQITNIPVAESGSVGDNIKSQANARVGLSVGFGGISTLTAPSWDSIAYCIINAMIVYISDSTIQWINTGFNGNPAFLTNPDTFFKQLVDEEAGIFVQNLAYGVTGVNICEVFKASIVMSAVNQYNQSRYGSNYTNRGLNNGFLGCTFDKDTEMLKRFVNGQFIQGGGWDSWNQLTQNPRNNPYDVYFNVNDMLVNTINKSVSSSKTELGWNNGFLTFKKCTDPKDKKTCTSITPGNVIQNQLNETLNLGKNRLVLADKFDQVVTALVNQLIKTALGKALEAVQQ